MGLPVGSWWCPAHVPVQVGLVLLSLRLMAGFLKLNNPSGCMYMHMLRPVTEWIC